MKALLLILLTTSALAADLKPNAKLTFDFPELPNTLAGMVSSTKKVARLGDSISISISSPEPTAASSSTTLARALSFGR